MYFRNYFTFFIPTVNNLFARFCTLRLSKHTNRSHISSPFNFHQSNKIIFQGGGIFTARRKLITKLVFAIMSFNSLHNLFIVPGFSLYNSSKHAHQSFSHGNFSGIVPLIESGNINLKVVCTPSESDRFISIS